MNLVKSVEGLTWKGKRNGKEAQFVTHCGPRELSDKVDVKLIKERKV